MFTPFFRLIQLAIILLIKPNKTATKAKIEKFTYIYLPLIQIWLQSKTFIKAIRQERNN